MINNPKISQSVWSVVFFVFVSANIFIFNTNFAAAQTASSTNATTTPTLASTSASIISATSSIATSTAKAKATSTYMQTGRASWYNYKGGLFAASPDFPKGTMLRVTSVSNPKKYVDVVVNDWGPDRVKHPDRVIDLDKQAFAVLAPLGAGIISVKVEPLKIASSTIKTNPVILAASSAVAVKVKDVQTNNDLKLTSLAGIVVNAKNGQILWQKNSNNQMPLASLTKLVAAKVFMDTKPNLKKVVAYKKIDEQKTFQWAEPGLIAKLKVKEGETMTTEDLLNAALIGSANNSIESLVRTSGITRKQFIARMNKYVKDIGAKNTKFVEPTGLAPQNVSSVKDYAIISRKVLANPTISKISSAKSYSFKTRNTKQLHVIKNSNKLMAQTTLKITGSKTGYLDEAQYCLMTRAKSKAGEVIAVTFGTPNKTANFEETKKLIEYGFRKL